MSQSSRQQDGISRSYLDRDTGSSPNLSHANTSSDQFLNNTGQFDYELERIRYSPQYTLSSSLPHHQSSADYHRNTNAFGQGDPNNTLDAFAPTTGMLYGGQETGSFGQVQNMISTPTSRSSHEYLRNHPQVLSHPSNHAGPPFPPSSSHPSSSTRSRLTLPQPARSHQENRAVLLYDTRSFSGRLKQYVIYKCDWISDDGLTCNKHFARDNHSMFLHLKEFHGVRHGEKMSCQWGGLCSNNSRSMLPASIPRHLETHLGIKWGCSSCNFIATRPDIVKSHTVQNTSCSGAEVKEIHGSGALFVDSSWYLNTLVITALRVL
ncbi:hypothetical protein BJ138DRAFT_1099692 [Hygrophoropsis aurantiaca]|uniref:Uncharacterized protein n=1 Tax=Hygrophoropsis aurantiaca TaxID=72124 RepID=A0ACB8AIQ8_9AGAM|nr:hypothetical protein BJ138DRAFT_1099692 [Hygrophoropsis aurantiaca]